MQGETYAGYVQAQLDRERARRDMLNARAATAVTSTAGLATLTFAAVALAQGHPVHGAALALAVSAVMVTLIGSVLAVAAGYNIRFDAPSIAALTQMLGQHWDDTETTALSATAAGNVRVISSLHEGTKIKMRLFIASQASQATSITLLAGSLLLTVSAHG